MIKLMAGPKRYKFIRCWYSLQIGTTSVSIGFGDYNKFDFHYLNLLKKHRLTFYIGEITLARGVKK